MNDNNQNKTSIDDPLDDALSNWANRKTADAEHLAGLTKQIQMRLLEPSSNVVMKFDDVERGSVGFRWFRGGTLAKISMAVAALLLVGLGLYGILTQQTNEVHVGDANDQTISQLVRSNVVQQRRLLEQFHNVYGDQLRWVADNNGRLKVELAEKGPNRSQGFLGIRLWLVSRPVNSNMDQDWTLMHTCNLLTNQEVMIEVPAGESEFAEFTVWAFPVDQNLINVDLQYRINGPAQIEFETSELVRDGNTDQVGSVVKNNVEYRLYQTASRIAKNQDVEQEMVPAVRGCP